MRGEEYIHAFQPILQSTQGIHYLPCFHVVVTLTSSSNVSLQLLTYHGKPLKGETIPVDLIDDIGNELSILKDIELNRLQLCQGIQDVRVEEVEAILKTSSLPIHEKVRSLFLIEQLENQAVFRSRTCSFAVYDSHDDVAVCDNCNQISNSRSLPFNQYLDHVKGELINPAALMKKVDTEKIKPKDIDASSLSFLHKVKSASEASDKEMLKALQNFQTLSDCGIFDQLPEDNVSSSCDEEDSLKPVKEEESRSQYFQS